MLRRNSPVVHYPRERVQLDAQVVQRIFRTFLVGGSTVVPFSFNFENRNAV